MQLKHIIMGLVIFGVLSVAQDSTVDMASQGMSILELQQGALMENIVNNKTPGFRELVIDPIYDHVNGRIIAHSRNRFNPGPFIRSGRNLDVAVQGRGFLAVMDKNGRLLLTRDGRFEVDREQRLRTLSGQFFVVDDYGAPIILPTAGSIKIDQEGNLYDSSDQFIARLKVVEVNDVRGLESLNNVFFAVREPSNIVDADSRNLKQGYYEGSNVDSNRLLVQMTDKNIYGANSQVIQTRLKMLDTVTNILQQN